MSRTPGPMPWSKPASGEGTREQPLSHLWSRYSMDASSAFRPLIASMICDFQVLYRCV